MSINYPVKINKARCLICKDIIESNYQHDFKFCSCGNLSVDGGHSYIRRGSKKEDSWEELSVYGEKEFLGESDD